MTTRHLEVVKPDESFISLYKVVHTVEVHSAPGEDLSRVIARLRDEYPGHLIREVPPVLAAKASNWWDSGNDLALVEAMRKFARQEDGDFHGETHSRLNSHLIGAARALGMFEDDIRDAFDSDRSLTIYEP